MKSRIKSPSDLVLIVRKTILEFTNAKDHEATLLKFVGKPVRLTGTWLVDKIEIAKIEPDPSDR